MTNEYGVKLDRNGEIFKLIEGLKYPYYISNFGRVFSVTGRGWKGNCKKYKKPFEKKLQKDKQGYLFVSLPKENGEYQNLYVHRLVAQAFVDNPKNLSVVNHLDFNPLNNNSSNLEWTTNYGNFKYSEEKGRYKRTKTWISNLRKSAVASQGKSVIGISETSGNIIELKFLNEARDYGFNPSGVCNCCKGNCKTHHGYSWRYSNEK